MGLQEHVGLIEYNSYVLVVVRYVVVFITHLHAHRILTNVKMCTSTVLCHSAHPIFCDIQFLQLQIYSCNANQSAHI